MHLRLILKVDGGRIREVEANWLVPPVRLRGGAPAPALWQVAPHHSGGVFPSLLQYSRPVHGPHESAAAVERGKEAARSRLGRGAGGPRGLCAGRGSAEGRVELAERESLSLF